MLVALFTTISKLGASRVISFGFGLFFSRIMEPYSVLQAQVSFLRSPGSKCYEVHLIRLLKIVNISFSILFSIFCFFYFFSNFAYFLSISDFFNFNDCILCFGLGSVISGFAQTTMFFPLLCAKFTTGVSGRLLSSDESDS